jgi:hypothetical protein
MSEKKESPEWASGAILVVSKHAYSAIGAFMGSPFTSTFSTTKSVT